MRAFSLSCALATVLAWTSLARAQGDDPLPPPEARPTSGEASLLSGRTLGTGEVMIAGAAGWPWIWVQLELAPTSGFNLGVRAALLYGSPVMGVRPGVGAEISVPMRIHLHGKADVDVAVFVTPALALGEGATAGELTLYAGDLGYSTRLEAGGLVGIRLQERLTFFLGAGGHAGIMHTPNAGGPDVVGAVFAEVGLEGLISRDTMLFADVQGGLGITRQGLFEGPVAGLLRVSLGLAYLF